MFKQGLQWDIDLRADKESNTQALILKRSRLVEGTSKDGQQNSSVYKAQIITQIIEYHEGQQFLSQTHLV